MARMVGQTSEGYSRLPKSKSKQREKTEVRSEVNAAINSRRTESKCSKPAGEYCRIHNPAPRFVNMSPEQVFDKAIPRDINLAATITPPLLDDHLEAIDADLTASRRALHNYAKSKGIAISDIHLYVYGEGDEEDSDLKFLNDDYHENVYAWDDAMETRNLILNRYMNKMIDAEFPSAEQAKIAKAAAFAKFSSGEDERDEDNPQIEATGLTRKEFHAAINESSFKSRLRNVEKAWISTAQREPASEKDLDALEKVRATLIIAKDRAKAKEEAFQAYAKTSFPMKRKENLNQ